MTDWLPLAPSLAYYDHILRILQLTDCTVHEGVIDDCATIIFYPIRPDRQVINSPARTSALLIQPLHPFTHALAALLTTLVNLDPIPLVLKTFVDELHTCLPPHRGLRLMGHSQLRQAHNAVVQALGEQEDDTFLTCHYHLFLPRQYTTACSYKLNPWPGCDPRSFVAALEAQELPYRAFSVRTKC
ncbi:hypothetical protein GMRT_10823 [Giardia muris]|uniref:Uncharacterized protein n=1 Tax=Giardia muris TaxID=5742 RepID=A0A4Z1SPE7_GIAMU|nr:hypothetical protein GMRT_10823 [Giardia muris]|eukprot:TNJ27520.1 hypothetical protein GMRT_10823 [Giardia muris]